MSSEMYDNITNKIIDIINRGTGAWKAPYINAGIKPSFPVAIPSESFIVKLHDRRSYPSLRSVFNISTDKAQQIVNAMPDMPGIKTGTKIPHYDFDSDTVIMPDNMAFPTMTGYYSALFHELSHATGHSKRLARRTLLKRVDDSSEIEDEAREELVAELSACFLNAHAGILDAELENSAAYLRQWADHLPWGFIDYIYEAAREARHVTRFILGAV